MNRKPPVMRERRYLFRAACPMPPSYCIFRLEANPSTRHRLVLRWVRDSFALRWYPQSARCIGSGRKACADRSRPGRGGGIPVAGGEFGLTRGGPGLRIRRLLEGVLSSMGIVPTDWDHGLERAPKREMMRLGTGARGIKELPCRRFNRRVSPGASRHGVRYAISTTSATSC